MANAPGSRSFPAETAPVYGLSDANPRRQHLENPPRVTPLPNPFQETPSDETLLSSFSNLDMNREHSAPGFDGQFLDWPFLDDHVNDYSVLINAFSSRPSRNIEYTNQDSVTLNLQNSFSSSCGYTDLQNYNYEGLVSCLDSTLNNFSQIRTRRSGFVRDFRNGELNNESSITPSSKYKAFLNNTVPKNQAVSRSNFNFSSLGDLKGNIVGLAKDQYGCRYLQRTMSGLSKEEIDMIFSEVIDRVCELMIDPFGNYVVQKLVGICTEEQRTQILLMLTKVDFQLVRICLSLHGTRAVLRLLENLATPQQISLVTTALSTGAVALTKDADGHHVIQYCLKHFSHEDNKNLLDEVANNCYGIATDKSGCCVLQYCVEYSQGAQREHLVAEIIANALLLAEDCYGNYVVQHLLGLRVPQITANLLRQLEGHYTSLSCNKYGSNVVERCLIESGEQQSTRIVMELLRSPNVTVLLMDPFGNYVIQSALSVSKGFVRNALKNLIKINSPMMRSNIYGKKVLAWFEKRRLSYI